MFINQSRIRSIHDTLQLASNVWSLNVSSPSRASKACLFGMTLIALGTSLGGLNFGYHWDEAKMLNSIQRAAETGRFLPGWYQYPSLCFWLGLLAKPLSALWSSEHGDLDSLRFTLRSMMAVITLATGLWTYALVRLWRRSNLEALVAAGIVLLSFEINYHSRWIAPDGLMMHFGIASMYYLTRFWV